ncbi:TPA: hypothetical protein KT787_000774 [Enterococcus faecium]|nr:hypothetical protein [Enterococcus faecium]
MTKETSPKDRKLRHAEYYGMTEIFDKIYSKSLKGDNFKNLMQIIISDNNIVLAYRNIKRNHGSVTRGEDGVTIKDIENLNRNEFVEIVRKRFAHYNPRKVRRVEIPKYNGKLRPLGIPSIWDRIAQQCILQVLEPICEAKFNNHSYGFRPNRSAEHAIADCMARMNQSHMEYVVDVDIKGFFDEVNHTKLMRQIWSMGIRDKQLLLIIRKMLRAPVVLPNGKLIYPTKGTPQGGILSPLLANINFIAQKGRCAVTGEELILSEMHCHHIIPYHESKSDSYENLVIVTEEVHRVIHATQSETIEELLKYLKLNPKQKEKLNELRLKVGNEEIS